MNTQEFLELVVPDGNICIADHIEIGDDKVFVHYTTTRYDVAAKLAMDLDSKGHTIYYAMATFRETHTNKNGKLRVKRTRKNVDRLKSIWLDIDFKDCGPEELVPKLGQFLKDAKLPKPTMIVNSGGGLHVYWCLEKAISLADWVPLAEGLKHLCKTHDLPADHVCTSDAARVLRPLGTHNRKYDPQKEVRLVAGDKNTYSYEQLSGILPKPDLSSMPAHLRGKAKDSGEYSNTGFKERPVNTAKVVRNCAVLRHVLATGGAEQSEPEWNATLLLLRFLPDGGKLVHPMSKKHIDYDAQSTNDKWQEKLAADVTGPPLCSTLEQYGHTKRCQNCPIYKSKTKKTPLALGYTDGEDQPTQKSQKNSRGIFVPVSATPAHDFPYGWRAMHGNEGTEKKVRDKETGEWTWEKVLRRTWRLRQAQKSTNTGEYTYVVEAKTITGKPIHIEISGADLWGSTRTWETLSLRGAPLTTQEQPHWKDLMATWLQKLQEESAVLDTTEQLGWIERTDEENHKSIVGFATGRKAFFKDGTVKQSVVTAHHKHKGIAGYYTPVGVPEKWTDVFNFYKKQGLNHLMVMLASAFAGPLVKFTGQSGAVLALVSTGTSAGKSLSLEAAQAVWGNPKLGAITLQDTPTSVKNKLAYTHNLTAFWDEVRGDDKMLHDFIQIVFQITQGKDRERSDRSARTIAAQTWHTMLACTSNDSVFDIAGSETGASDAGVYRIFECFIPPKDKPPRDPAISSMVAELQNHYGMVGEVYGEYLAKHVTSVQNRVNSWRLKVEEHFSSDPAERFWVATVASLLAGAEAANKAGVADFDIRELAQYLFRKYSELRTRVISTKEATDPKELLVAYQMQHQHERLVVDKLRTGPGGKYEPQLIGNYANVRKITYQLGMEQHILRVVAADFNRWLRKTRGLRMSGELEARFKQECGMKKIKATLGAGTQFATSQSWCYDFNLPPEGELDLE